MNFDAAELTLFQSLPIPDESWPGSLPRAWLNGVLDPSEEPVSVPESQMRRLELRAYCASTSVSDESCFLTVMAWGGMRRNHARRAWRCRANWLSAIAILRGQTLSRRAAYELLSRLRPDELPGVGPAYFTKLLFFLRPRPDSYILDQWTAKSVQVLTGQRVWPDLIAGPRKAARVSDRVSSEDYERYCSLVDVLADDAGVEGAMIEQKLFCRGGHKPGPWRDHVRRSW